MKKRKLDITKSYISKGFIPIAVRFQQHSYKKKENGVYINRIISEKAPVASNWQNTKLDQAYQKMENYLNQDERYNIGIITGKASGIIVIDIDKVKKDDEKDGMEKWEQMMKEHGEIKTLKAKTPSGGYHYFFKYNSDAEMFKGTTKVGGYSIDIRSDGNQVLVYPSGYENKGSYLWESDEEITEMPKWLYEFLVDATFKQVSTKPSKKKKKDKNNNEIDVSKIREEFYVIEEEQIRQCRYLLNKLPPRYHDNYDLWRDVGFALSYTSEKFLPLFIEFSRKSAKFKSEDDCISFWNSIKNNKDENIRIGSLIYVFRSENKNDKTQFSFPITKVYEPISRYKEHPNLDIIYGNDKYIPATIADKFMQYKINLIKSPTGSGKTYIHSQKYLPRIYKDRSLSIVSRQAMAYKQKEDFRLVGIDNAIYCESKYVENNMICQVDSLYKLEKELYYGCPLFLDEFNSITSYFRSGTLEGKRKEVFEIFIDLVINASHIYCADADMSDMAINFLFNIFKKNQLEIPATLLYWNKVKNVNTKAYFYQSFGKIMGEIYHSLEINKPFILACDSKSQMELIIEKCREFCLDQKLDGRVEDFLVYSREEGDNKDFVKINELWKDRYVFFTPKIIYGLSFESMKTDVYGIFFNDSINPLNMMQQISRCRDIDSLKIYIKDNTKELQYDSLDDVREYVDQLNIQHSILMNRRKVDEYDISDVIYAELHAYDEYYNDILKSYAKYHLKAILEEKGFIIEDVVDLKDDIYDDKAMNEILKKNNDKDLKTIFDSFEDKTIKLNLKQRNKKEKIKNRMHYLQINKSQLDEEILDLMLNDTKYKQHLYICKAFMKEEIRHHMYIYLEDKEFKENIWRNIYDKIKMINKLENYLDISPFCIDRLAAVDVLEGTIINNFQFKVSSEHIKKLFNFKNIIMKTNYDVYRYLTKMYIQLYGDSVIISDGEKQVRISNSKKYKKCYTYKLNQGLLKQHYNLLKYRNDDIRNLDPGILNLLEIKFGFMV